MALKKTEVSSEAGESEQSSPELTKEQPAAIEPEAMKQMLEKMGAMEKKISSMEKSGGSGSQTADIINALTKRSEEEKFGGSYTRVEDMDPGDLLSAEEAVTFFAYKTEYVIVDDKRNGFEVKTPYYNEIFFKQIASRAVKNGKDTDIFTLCSYVCRSKKEVEWLRAHTFYNTLFFDKQQTEITQDAVFASYLSKAMMGLKTMNQIQIVGLAKDRGMTLSQDINIMRTELATLQARDQTKKAVKVSQTALQEAQKDTLVIQK
jgi:hypothetical protein